jgi:hypothetical protein
VSIIKEDNVSQDNKTNIGENIQKELTKIDNLHKINDELKKNFKDIVFANRKKLNNELTRLDLEPEIKIASERIVKGRGHPKSKKLAYFRLLADQLNENKKEDIEYGLIERLYEIAMGRTVLDKENHGTVPAITFLIDRFVAKDEDVIPHTAGFNDEDIGWDTPQAINDMAARIMYLMLHRYITVKTAERMIELLRQKVSFIETGVLMQKLEEVERMIQTQSVRIDAINPPLDPHNEDN